MSLYPQRIDCPACGRLILVTLGNLGRDITLAFDPDPDGDGEHFDTTMADDLSYVRSSGEMTAAECKGRFPLYRSHFWTCPNQLAVPAGKPALAIGGYYTAEPS